jgi:perosamine synthetase
MSIEFLPMLADGSNFPTPEFSMLPKKRGKARIANRPVNANAKNPLSIIQARYGLAIIAKAELAPGSKVLLPAYHCPALVEPFIWAQCSVDFYPLNEDLTPQRAILTRKLESADAMVFVPYFGFSCTAVGLADLARQYNCLPIEDLAHAALNKGLDGDYGVTSLEKFYPVDSGGELLIANSVSNTRVADWWQLNHISPWRSTVENRLTRKIANLLNKPAVNHIWSNNFRYFDPSKVGATMMHKDIRQLANQDHAKITMMRRDNYQKLDAYFCRSRLGRPVFQALGADDVPYVYPFVLNKAEHFDLIRNKSIPLYRWEEICPSGCETSNLYRSQLVQFPCHQDLTHDDIDRLISKLEMAESNR